MNIVLPSTLHLHTHPITHTVTLTPSHIHTTVSPSSSFQESLTLQDTPQLPKSGEERRREGGREGRVRRGGSRDGGGREGRGCLIKFW